MKWPVRTLLYCALFAALTAVCSQIAIPTGFAAPINFATFSVFLAGILLGPGYGTLSQLCFLLLGAVGLPVFSGFRGGIGALFGVTGGYLLGYLLAAWFTGWITKRFGTRTHVLLLSMLGGLFLCYAFGTAWYMWIQKIALVPALAACVIPYLPGDAVKIALVLLLVPRLSRFFHPAKA